MPTEEGFPERADSIWDEEGYTDADPGAFLMSGHPIPLARRLMKPRPLLFNVLIGKLGDLRAELQLNEPYKQNCPSTKAGCDVYNKLQNESNIQNHLSTLTCSGRDGMVVVPASPHLQLKQIVYVNCQVHSQAMNDRTLHNNNCLVMTCTGYRRADVIPTL